MDFILFLKRITILLAVVSALTLGSDAHAEKLFKHAPHSGTQLVDTSNKTLPGGAPTLTFSRNGITFNIYYMDVIMGTGNGFAGATTGIPAQARLRETLEYIADVVNMTGTLNVRVEESIFVGGGTLASAGSFFFTNPGFQKPLSLLSLENGSPISPGTEEIFVTVDFSYNWNLTTNPPTGAEVDFLSVMLHEMTHGLGFAGLMDASGAGLGGTTYSTFTQFIYGSQTNGRVVTNPGPTYVGTGQELANNPSLMSFDGPLTQADNGGRPGIYAPSPFASGSSLSHWDTGQVPGNPVMEHAIPNGVMKREYASYEVETLKDIGWINAAPLGILVNFSSPTYSVNEAGASTSIDVTLSEIPGASTVMVTYDTGQGGDSATNNVDYNDATGVLSFTGSEVLKSFTITINDDSDIEGDENVTLLLSNPQNASLGSTDTAILTIVDDEIDTDGDGLTDAQELLLGTSITLTDTDGDGISDFNEVTNFGNNPIGSYNPGVTNTDANNADTDGDGFSDLTERNFGTDPLNINEFPSLPLSNTLTLCLVLLAISLAGTRVLRKQNS